MTSSCYRFDCTIDDAVANFSTHRRGRRTLEDGLLRMTLMFGLGTFSDMHKLNGWLRSSGDSCGAALAPSSIEFQ